jgi:hypothetical protein
MVDSVPLLTVLLLSLSVPQPAPPELSQRPAVAMVHTLSPSPDPGPGEASSEPGLRAGPAMAGPEAPLASESVFRLPSTGAVFLPAAETASRGWEGPAEAADTSFRWKPAIGSTLLVILTQNLANLTSSRFHDELEGPFLKDWFTSAGALFDSNWDDGNKIQTNYIAHPIGGAVYANNARMNDPKYAALLPGDRGYGTGVLRSMAFAAAASLMYEIGPVSEASLGNLGMKNPDKQGWVDPVMTPVLGAGWMVLEDVVHQQLLRRVDGQVPYTILHIFLNPARTISNLFNFRPPCPRERY